MKVVLEPTGLRVPKGTVILFFPRFAALQYPVWLPYEIMTIATSLEQAGYRVVALDERVTEDALNEAARWAEDALFVGISSRPGDQVDRALELFQVLKDRYPETPSVWGGWFPSSFPDACLDLHNVDFVVQGAADSSIVELAERIRFRQGDVTGIRGVSGALPGRTAVRNGRRPLEDIELSPQVDWRRFPLDLYVTEDGCTSHYTSRGCPGNCRFCGVTRLYPAVWSGYSAERVVDDLEYFVRELGVRIVKMNDVDMFADLDRMRAICQGMIKRFGGVRWIADIRAALASKIDDDTWRLLADSGCAELEFGAETGSEEQLEAIHKECSRAEIIRSARKIIAQGISARINFVLGFPGDTPATLQENIDLMEELQEMGPLVRLHFYRFTPSPSTRLGNQTWRMKSRDHDGEIPKTVRELNDIALNYGGGRMFWIDEKLESRIGQLLETYLPLAYYVAYRKDRGPKAFLMRRFATLARWRIRKSFFALPFESRLLRLFKIRLPGTREFEWADDIAAARLRKKSAASFPFLASTSAGARQLVQQEVEASA